MAPAHDPPPPDACSRTKKLHLIRHAEGTHNAAESAELERPTHELHPTHARLHAEHGVAWVLLHEVSGLRYRDPPLTPEGERQAAALRAEMEAAGVRVDAVAISPMRRTLQTAHIGVPHLQPSRRASTPTYTTELLRERVGPYACDERAPASELRAEFGEHVDFAEVAEEDSMFAEAKEHGPDEAATLAARATRFVEWVLERPEEHEHIAVVSHQHFLLAITSLFADDLGGERARERFRNAELRSVVLCERA
jgi:broad specificity phosphatase PhoE